MKKWIGFAAGAGLLSSGAPAQQQGLPIRQGPTPDTAEQICAPFLDGEPREQIVLTAAPIAVPLPPPPVVAPPPTQPRTATPPPPPPPPPILSAPAYVPPPAGQGVMVTGSYVSPALRPENRERYSDNEVSGVQRVADAPVSTFGVDVDTGSYANVRRMLIDGSLPPQDAVRTEELLNYFRYDYPAPTDRRVPFTVNTDVAVTPWNADTRLLRIGLRGYDVSRAERPPANLVFLIDVSGSMGSLDKLPLVQCSLALTAERLRPDDRVSIVVYAGAAGLVLEPTADKARVIDAIGRLQAGGSTAGGAGLALAYATAKANKREGGINRILLATDGDFNVGVTRDETLTEIVEREAKSGVTLTTLGFGTGNYNEAMMEQIADHGNGNYAYIDGPAEAMKVLDDELSSTLFTIAKDVKVQVEFNPAVISEYRLIGYENRALTEEEFADDAVDAGDIGAGHQVTALYEVVPAGAKGWLPEREFAANRRGAGQGDPDGRPYVLKLRYKLPDEDRSRLIEASTPRGEFVRPRAPSGDFAFASAVAAYGQKLRGDRLLADFGWERVGALAGRPETPLRREFVTLVERVVRMSAPASDLPPVRR